MIRRTLERIRRRSLGLICALGVVAATAPMPAQSVQLKDGTLLVGEVVDPRDDGFTLRRIDTGGVVDIRWGQLSPASADRLRHVLRLSVDDQSEVLVTADVLEYASAGATMTIVGRIVDETPTELRVRYRGQIYPIARTSIRGRSQATVPVMQIQTKDEYYGDQLQSIQPGEIADRHIQLADLLMRVRDYDRADLHLQQADALGGATQPEELKGKLQRLKLLQGAKAERDHLEEIATWRNRGDFARAGQLLAEFEKKYPQTRLKQELVLEQDRYTRARDRVMTRNVTERWLRSLSDLTGLKAAESGVTLAQARSYAESELPKAIRARVAQQLGLKADEVDAFWKRRTDKTVGAPARAERYAYGIGSWVLGADRILKDTKQGDAEKGDAKDQPTAADRELERIARRMAEARRRSQQAASAKNEQVTEEDWWKAAQRVERALWLRAYYAENSGDLAVENAYSDPCITCAGEGTLEVTSDTGRPEKRKCPTCQGTRFMRSFRAR